MRFMPLLRSALAGFVLAISWAVAAGQPVQPVPALTAHVMDQTGTLSAQDQAALEARLQKLEEDKGSQVVILMVPTTAPEDIFSYANRVASTWKIGRREVGDGLLVVVAKNDRQMRIEVARALEGAIPDIAASHIIAGAMAPRFRQGDFAGGLDAAVDQIGARIRGEPLPPVANTGQDGRAGNGGIPLMDLLVVLLIFMPLVNAVVRGPLGRRGGAAATGVVIGIAVWIFTASVLFALLAAFASSVLALSGAIGRRGSGGGGWGGGGGGFGGGFGGGGGGFGSGGGGSFGGGGASGRW